MRNIILAKYSRVTYYLVNRKEKEIEAATYVTTH